MVRWGDNGRPIFSFFFSHSSAEYGWIARDLLLVASKLLCRIRLLQALARERGAILRHRAIPKLQGFLGISFAVFLIQLVILFLSPSVRTTQREPLSNPVLGYCSETCLTQVLNQSMKYCVPKILKDLQRYSTI